MRMWMLDPRVLCRRHLLGEHVELHMLIGSILRGKTLDGFVRHGLIQPEAIAQRHTDLVEEMLQRGYRHQSPVDAESLAQGLASYSKVVREAVVDVVRSKVELIARCEACRERFL